MRWWTLFRVFDLLVVLVIGVMGIGDQNVVLAASRSSHGHIAFVRENGGQNSICIVEVDSRTYECVKLDQTDVNEPKWSPDGSSIAFVAKEENGNYSLYIAQIKDLQHEI